MGRYDISSSFNALVLLVPPKNIRFRHSSQSIVDNRDVLSQFVQKLQQTFRLVLSKLFIVNWRAGVRRWLIAYLGIKMKFYKLVLTQYLCVFSIAAMANSNPDTTGAKVPEEVVVLGNKSRLDRTVIAPEAERLLSMASAGEDPLQAIYAQLGGRVNVFPEFSWLESGDEVDGDALYLALDGQQLPMT